ncbi:MAG: prepilin-type N-terminal cleavage/methylation domain-containing protein [Deltaproteobacteria bacterium]|nr:prepilin-type N-terminal cleavage/methylation domain-containing protein [Deltaproteobacteria bacterium]
MKPEIFKRPGPRFTGEAQGGFTLLEVMAALAIAGFGVLMALQLFSGGLNSAKAARDYTAAVLHAEEKMNEALLNDAPEEGVRSGAAADGYEWTVAVDRYDTGALAYDRGIIIYRVAVKVRNPEGRKEYALETLKVYGKEVRRKL